MEITITSVSRVDDPGELRESVVEYLATVAPEAARRLGVAVDADDAARATLDNLNAYLPPRGSLLLARDPHGTLVGMIFTKMIRPDAAEFKRLYVRDAARGTGLGRRLTAQAMDEARALGAAQVYIDTGEWLTTARRLYESLGFRYVDRYPETENGPEMDPILVYMVCDL